MKILFLDHPQFTSASFFLWHGLNEVLSKWSVLAYPHIPTHYNEDMVNFGSLPWFSEMRDRALRGELPSGVPPFAPGEDLTGGGQMVTKRYESSRRFAPPGSPPTEDSVVASLSSGEFSLIVLSNSHRVPTIALGRLRERARALPPIVYYDAGERDELNEHWIHVFRPSLVFKQILTPAVAARGLSVPIKGYGLRMLPLPLSSPIVGRGEHFVAGIPIEWMRDNDDPLEKMFDVFYSMGPTWEGRAPVLSMLDALCRDRGLSTIGNVTYKNYHLVLSRSRTAVTMRGSGRDTQRYWEVPLYKTLMLADGTMGCLHPYAFEDGKTAVFWRSVDELREKVLRYAPRAAGSAEEQERLAISRAGKEHLWKYHSTGSRAVFFLDRVKESLPGVVDGAADEAVSRWKQTFGWDGRPWQSPAIGGEL